MTTTTNTTTFTLNNGTIYTRYLETNRFAKTIDEKTTRISKAEYETAVALQAEMQAEIDRMAEADAKREEERLQALEAELLEAAEDDNVTLDQFIELVQEAEAVKKARKPRRSKDIAFEMSPNGSDIITLTAKQVDFIRHLPDTCYWENGLDSWVWTDILADEIGGQFAGKPMTVGAMISTICEKGLAFRGKDRINGRMATYMGLTDMGKQVAEELGVC